MQFTGPYKDALALFERINGEVLRVQSAVLSLDHVNTTGVTEEQLFKALSEAEENLYEWTTEATMIFDTLLVLPQAANRVVLSEDLSGPSYSHLLLSTARSIWLTLVPIDNKSSTPDWIRKTIRSNREMILEKSAYTSVIGEHLPFEFRDAMVRAATQSSTAKAEGGKFPPIAYPTDPLTSDLVKKRQAAARAGDTDIAELHREFKAQHRLTDAVMESLKRNARNYRHLWEGNSTAET